MRRAARAIVIKDDHLLVMHRNKFGREYYTLIGGGVDAGETIEQALVRELEEETTVIVADPRLVIVEDAGNIFGVQYIYLCQYVSGTPFLSPHSEEAKISSLGKNMYTPMWLPLAKLADVPFLSKQLQGLLIKGLRDGFDQTPIHIQST